MKIEPKLEINVATIALLLILAALVVWAYKIRQQGLVPSIGEAAGTEMMPWFGQHGSPAWTVGVPPLMVLWDLFNG